MAGINAERDMWKHLTEVMDRLNKVEQEAKKQHTRWPTKACISGPTI